MEIIPVNIWDDYTDDDFVAEGQKQQTCIFVDDVIIPDHKQNQYLQILLDFINENIILDEVIMWIAFCDFRVASAQVGIPACFRWEIKVENLTHERREMLVSELNKESLFADRMPFIIYSES